MKVAIITALMLCSLFSAQTFAAEIKNYEAAGNLESKYDIGCAAPEKWENKYTPADIFKCIVKCVEQEKYREGAFLFALAGVYGRFDTFRVADRTAHQAVTVLRMQALEAMEKKKKDTFIETGKKTLGAPEEVCKEIIRLGPPDYTPRYMIQHGMGAFSSGGSTDGLVANFDTPSAWKKSLDTYLHCPGL